MDTSQDGIIDSVNILTFNTVFLPCTSEGSSATLILHMEGTSAFAQSLRVACGTVELKLGLTILESETQIIPGQFTQILIRY